VLNLPWEQKSERNKELKRKRRTRRERKSFSSLIYWHITALLLWKRLVWEEKCPDERVYIYVLRFTHSIITSSCSLFPLPSYVRLYQWCSGMIKIDLLFRDSFSFFCGYEYVTDDLVPIINLELCDTNTHPLYFSIVIEWSMWCVTITDWIQENFFLSLSRSFLIRNSDDLCVNSLIISLSRREKKGRISMSIVCMVKCVLLKYN
jgi:hypothetical protein